MPHANSFLFYLDSKEVLEILTDAQLGQLLRYLIDYAETGTMQEIKDVSVQMAYRFMTAQMRRDMEKYEKKCKKNAENAKKGGAPKGNRNAVKCNSTENNRTVDKTTETSERFKKQPKQPYTETDTETDTDTETETENKTSAKSPRRRCGEYKHVLLTKQEHAALVANFGESETAEYIRRLDEYLEQTGKTYRNHSLTIRRWMERDGRNAKEDMHEKYAGTAAGKGFI